MRSDFGMRRLRIGESVSFILVIIMLMLMQGGKEVY